MLPSYLLALREGIEAALIIGIILGLLKKINKKDLIPVVWTGAGTAALVRVRPDPGSDQPLSTSSPFRATT